MPHVLVIEDDPFTARRLLRLLVSRGVCQVMHATTVAQALGLLEPPPDWVILDMNLPDGTGLVVLEAIRRAELPTRVVVSSATKDSALVAAFAAYKPDLIIPKPLNPALLPF
jgi:CheY-like chemotaxis protein